MTKNAKEEALVEARQAQAKFVRAKSQLGSASEERRARFEKAKAAGLSLAEIGKAVGLHRSRVDQILRGK